jgi:hypothetical protein
MRTRLQENMMMLRKTFRAALKDDTLQDAFDRLWPAWADEQAAMIHTQIPSPLDLLILTATVDNRREIMKIQRALEEKTDNDVPITQVGATGNHDEN